MYYLVTHRWEKSVEPEALHELTELCKDAYYGKVGEPWPRLFYVWLDPKDTQAFALWESAGPAPLEQVLGRLQRIQTEKVHVKQIYPAHIDLYSVARIETAAPSGVQKG